MENISKIKSQPEEIINIDEAMELEDSPIVSGSSKSSIYIYFSMLIFTACVTVAYCVMVLADKPLESSLDRTAFFKYEIVFYLLISIYLWGFFSLWIAIRNNIPSFEYSAFNACLDGHSVYVKNILVLVSISVFISAFSKIISSRVVNVAESEDVVKNISFWSYFIGNFPNITLGIASFWLIIFIKNMGINYIAYKMHFNSFIDRIKENEKNIKMIGVINRASGRSMYENISDWARFIFKSISKDGRAIHYTDLKLKFNNSVLEAIYSFFEYSPDKKITENEIIQMYKSIINERKNILDALSQTKVLLVKFNQLMSVVCYPLAFFTMQNIIGMNFSYIDILSHTQLLLSVKFIFEGVVQEIFNSLFFIFFIRSFDIGDIIDINGDLYKVVDMGILQSEYIKNGKLVIIPNSRLMSAKIINFRLCKFKDTVFEFKLRTVDFLKISKDLEVEIRNYTRKNKKMFSDRFELKEYNFEPNDVQIIKVQVTFKLKAHKLTKIKEEEDLFKLMVIEFLKKREAELVG
ncbi:Mechanosensitive ion channel protein Msy1 [Nosema granulosis]|uniref:Mechanosensitive ion channel protein Msy1 n=1 Tax=Nosema granulosis TaxID=83296 RepID=A0A9P6H0R2_9MICR|nr:Mechanosensitive ion channel protein Msy1 [Nosema granulosis]